MLSRRDVNELISTFLPLPGFKVQNLQEREFIVHFSAPLSCKGTKRERWKGTSEKEGSLVSSSVPRGGGRKRAGGEGRRYEP